MTDPPESSSDFDEFELANRRRKGVTVAIVGIVVVLAGAAVIWRQTTGLPGLDSDTEKSVREALPEIAKLPIDVRRGFAAEAIAELEPERLPAPLVEAFADYASAPPEYGGMLLLEPFTEPDIRAAWESACPAGLGAIADGAAEGAALTFDRCELGRLGLVTKSELAGASLGELAATHAAWAWLVDHGAETDLERRLFRMLILG